MARAAQYQGTGRRAAQYQGTGRLPMLPTVASTGTVTNYAPVRSGPSVASRFGEFRTTNRLFNPLSVGWTSVDRKIDDLM
jgi:hypothetical protein